MDSILVVIPVYNVAKYLKRCVDSIISQDFENYQILLIDDGSTDESGVVCDEYEMKCSKIKVVHQTNQGQASARNVGIDYAIANDDIEWIAFVDSDDLVHPQYLSALYNSVKKTHSKISMCGFCRFTQEFQYVKFNESIEYSMVDTETLYSTRNTNSVVPWGKIINKACFKDIRFPEGKICEDEFTMYQLLFKYDFLPFIDAPLYGYFTNPDSTMNKKWNPRRLNAFEAFENQLSFFQEHGFKKAYEKVLDSIAYTCSIHIKAIDNDYENRHYKCLLRKKLRKHLKTHKKQVGFSIKKNPMYYECAYPTLMKYYWIITSQLNKLKRKKNV